MAIHAKANGLLISGQVVDESENNWIFQAIDNKRPTVISKADPKNSVFTGDDAVNKAISWQDSVRKVPAKKGA